MRYISLCFACLLMVCFMGSFARSAPSKVWFSISVDGSPPRYTNQLSTLTPWVHRAGNGCVTSIRSGDALKIIQRPAPHRCHVIQGRLSARALLAFGAPLDLNHASIDELTLLKGVGPKLAEQIVNGRPWRELSSLLKLRGVGVKLLNKISAQLSVQPSPLIHVGVVADGH